MIDDRGHVTVLARLESQEGLKHNEVVRRELRYCLARISRRVETQLQLAKRYQTVGLARISRRVETSFSSKAHTTGATECLESQEGLKPVFIPDVDVVFATRLESQEGLKPLSRAEPCFFRLAG